MTRKVARLFLYTYLGTGSEMTWRLDTVFFVRTVTTVVKSITVVHVADANLVCTPELIDNTVARLLTCKEITMLAPRGLQKF
jgi:hypothetical protein